MILTPLQNQTRIRPDHNTAQPYTALVNIGSKIYGGEIWTAPATTAYNRQGDQWLKVETIDGANVTGWVAIVHNGNAICKEVIDTPAVEGKPVSMTLYFADGTKREYSVS